MSPNHPPLFSVIYSFVVKPGHSEAFEQAWKGMTELIFAHEGSLGSRLHLAGDLHYIAYAQWPDRQTWENYGDKLPPKAKEYSQAMRDACEKIDTLFKLDLVEDLLK
ncbi:MAG: antibiotic biosynthesis monooxygenase [Bacteroidia bacterium]|nr:antibiotic biosynthesis monooxygenase [Bacteroidia bacterium]